MISLVVVLVCSVFVLNTGAWAQQAAQEATPTLGAPQPWKLADKTGKVVGLVWEPTCCEIDENRIQVTALVSGRKVQLYADALKLYGTENIIFYETNNCTGLAYAVPPTRMIPPSIIVGEEWTLFVHNGAPRVITVGSSSCIETSGVPQGCGCGGEGQQVSVMPLKRLGDLRPLFTLPFRLQ